MPKWIDARALEQFGPDLASQQHEYRAFVDAGAGITRALGGCSRTARVREHGVANLEPMQLAALLLEKTTEQLSGDEATELVRSRRRRARHRCR